MRNPRRGFLERNDCPFRAGGIEVCLSLLHCLSEVALIRDVVAVKHARGPVTQEFHAHLFRYAGSSHIPGSRSPEIMEELPF